MCNSYCALDYQKPSGGNNTLQLNLLKFPAPKQPSKGNVLFNPGGPGDSGRTALVSGLALLVSAYTGFEYDIITWDPRGTGVTIPAVCYKSETDRNEALDRIPYISESNFDDTARVAFGAMGSLAEACKEALKETGELLGSAYVARDMVRIVDALGGDRMLRYYGASYGTALGMIFAAMFPERIESMVLDGVLNPHEYITGEDYQQLASTDAVFDGFLNACLSRPSLCPLATLNTTTADLKQQVYNALSDLETNPFAYGPNASQIATASLVSQDILLQLYSPASWTLLATQLKAIITKDLKTLAKVGLTTPPAPKFFNDQSATESIPAIRCSDVGRRVDSVEDVLPIAKTLLAQSPRLGGYVVSSQSLLCSQWPFVAKERYTGSFDVKTKKPILFVGNVFDPITSLDAARNASGTFEGSRLLVHEGYGHTSEQQLSKCTVDAVARYFSDGTLPDEGTVCRPDVPIFATEDESTAVAKAVLRPSV